MKLLNDDRTRAIDDEPLFGIAAYEGCMVDDKTWEGRHVGVFGNADDAMAWLETGEPKPPVVIEGRA